MRAVDTGQRRLVRLAGLITGVMSQFRPNLILIPAVLAAYAHLEATSSSIDHALGRAACLRRRLADAMDRAELQTDRHRRCRPAFTAAPNSGTEPFKWTGISTAGATIRARCSRRPPSVHQPRPRADSRQRRRSTCALDERHGSSDALLLVGLRSDAAPVETPDAHAQRRTSSSSSRRLLNRLRLTTTILKSAGCPMTLSPRSIRLRAARRRRSVYFVSQDHLGDFDRHHDLLDIFDVIRLARHEAWGEGLPASESLRRAGVTDARTAIRWLLPAAGQRPSRPRS